MLAAAVSLLRMVLLLVVLLLACRPRLCRGLAWLQKERSSRGKVLLVRVCVGVGVVEPQLRLQVLRSASLSVFQLVCCHTTLVTSPLLV